MAHGAYSLDRHPHALLWGLGVAVAVHVAVVLALAEVTHTGLSASVGQPVEVDLVAPPPPPPPPAPPAPSPPPPERAPRPIRHKLAHRPMRRPPPPMPNKETPPPAPKEEPAKPVFGVTQDSVVSGESSVAVPVGNTLMTKDRTVAKQPPAPLPPAPPPPAFAPVDEESVTEFPEAIYKPVPPYPELARRMGVEGKVRLKLGIDRKGNVKSVRVLQKAGYGMDEAAVKAAWQMKFKPAKGANGKPVDLYFHYVFAFHAPNQ